MTASRLIGHASSSVRRHRKWLLVSVAVIPLLAGWAGVAEQGPDLSTTNKVPLVQSAPEEPGIPRRARRRLWFSTHAYEREAFRLILAEANNAAEQLNLNEKLPITTRDLTTAYVQPYQMSERGFKGVGCITTTNYFYSVAIDHKLCFVESNQQQREGLNWIRGYTWPKSRIDTSGAYRLATQWLAAACIDVAGLSRHCELRVVPDPYWNSILTKRKAFVPIYYVSWRSPANKAAGLGSAASVTLFAPSNCLMSLRVEDSRYILRKPLVFTNLAVLLSQTNDPMSPTHQGPSAPTRE